MLGFAIGLFCSECSASLPHAGNLEFSRFWTLDPETGYRHDCQALEDYLENEFEAIAVEEKMNSSGRMDLI